MLFLVDPNTKVAASIPTSSFVDLQLKERFDIQEWVLNSPSILGEDLLVVSTEFDRFDRTSERLDVLAVDRKGKLVVIELKRTAVGTAAELQALRYSAFCSTFSLEDISELYSRHLSTREGLALAAEEARDRIIDFVGNPSFQSLDDKPRIILAAQEFPAEITATVLWLRTFGVDMTCVRLTPYRLGEQLVMDSHVLIPLPETKDFLVRRARKDVEQAPREEAPPSVDAFLEKAGEQIRPLARRLREWLVGRPDSKEGVFKTLISYRAASDNAWITWIELTRREVRVALPPEANVEGLDVIPTQYGWHKALVRQETELEMVMQLLAADSSVRHLKLTEHETEEWNGRDFYVSLGVGIHRTWEDCRRYGFISAGQGSWYSNTLKALEPGHRVFVYIPKTGYVGVGNVTAPAVPVRDFVVEVDGHPRPILEAPLKAPHMDENADDPETSEYVVRVDWIKTLPESNPVREKGMFANQNSACRLTHTFTRETLLERFNLTD